MMDDYNYDADDDDETMVTTIDFGNDNYDDGDVFPDRIKSLLKLLKKHNVYFGKFIIPRK